MLDVAFYLITNLTNLSSIRFNKCHKYSNFWSVSASQSCNVLKVGKKIFLNYIFKSIFENVWSGAMVTLESQSKSKMNTLCFLCMLFRWCKKLEQQCGGAAWKPHSDLLLLGGCIWRDILSLFSVGIIIWVQEKSFLFVILINVFWETWEIGVFEGIFSRCELKHKIQLFDLGDVLCFHMERPRCLVSRNVELWQGLKSSGSSVVMGEGDLVWPDWSH